MKKDPQKPPPIVCWCGRWQHRYGEVVGVERHLGGGIDRAYLEVVWMWWKRKESRGEFRFLNQKQDAATQNKGQLWKPYRPDEQYTRPQHSVQSKRQEPRLVLNGGASHFPILFWSLILFFSHFLFIGLKKGPSLGVPLRIQAIDNFGFFQQGVGRNENVSPSEVALEGSGTFVFTCNANVW